MKQLVQDRFAGLQDSICAALEELDGVARFGEDCWDYAPAGGERHGAGGGITRVIQRGGIFEKGGVNFSAVHGRLSPKIAERMGVAPREFFATGLSLVLHPLSPMIPTTHANVRYIQLAGTSDEPEQAWFGGGSDLTPYYLFEEDAREFHACFKAVCDRHDPDYYPRFKAWCDEYFHLPHRGEARGIGGVFFDYLKGDLPARFRFVSEVGESFLSAYAPIVRRRRREPWAECERRWQQSRRSRYVEFNLVYDRGTLFGLETGGRTESILMSMPPTARWEYDHRPEPGSREAALVEVLRDPVDWV